MAQLPATSLNSAFLLLQIISILGQPRWAYYISQSPNHDRPVELRCRGIVSVKQSSGCSTETGDDTAHFQVTTQSRSVPHLVCRRTEGTSTTARRCCGVFLWFWRWTQNCRLTYLLPCKHYSGHCKTTEENSDWRTPGKRDQENDMQTLGSGVAAERYQLQQKTELDGVEWSMTYTLLAATRHKYVDSNKIKWIQEQHSPDFKEKFVELTNGKAITLQYTLT